MAWHYGDVNASWFFELSGLAIFVMPVLAAFSIILAKDIGLCDRSRPDEGASL